MRRNPQQQYANLRMKTLGGREIEAAVLDKASFQLRRAQAQMRPNVLDEQTEEALQFNRRVWEVLRSDWQQAECALPKELREALLSLSVFVTRHLLDFRADPQPNRIDVLVQINENLVGGLRGAPSNAAEMAG